ncbi:hypothetical protein Hamer_G028866 [Homarus americanus]|uniref:Uncharacterized protein n=1 Tax=Homarus americanus TaxID=6706 RepID=A0A8J5MLN9_HOMAM|nr:hypothetical protein Hamer_G028866 [Homarus americanus]
MVVCTSPPTGVYVTTLMWHVTTLRRVPAQLLSVMRATTVASRVQVCQASTRVQVCQAATRVQVCSSIYSCSGVKQLLVFGVSSINSCSGVSNNQSCLGVSSGLSCSGVSSSQSSCSGVSASTRVQVQVACRVQVCQVASRVQVCQQPVVFSCVDDGGIGTVAGVDYKEGGGGDGRLRLTEQQRLGDTVRLQQMVKSNPKMYFKQDEDGYNTTPSGC